MSSNQNPGFGEFFSAATQIVSAAEEVGVKLRLLGATAIYLQCPNSTGLTKVLNRPLTDLDFVTLSKYVSQIPDLFARLKFVPNERVNTLYGASRQIYKDPQSNRHVDIFFDKLSFNHELDLSKRLDLDPVTISLADLLLEKLQIVKMSEKDAKDVVVLLNEHSLADGGSKGIDGAYIVRLLANDWGFCYTVQESLKKVRDYLGRTDLIPDESKGTTMKRVDELAMKINAEPKSFKWKVRARMGTRTPWYTEAEDVENRQ